MANIQTLLQRIMSAIYGEEVRGSIHDAIEAINDEVEEWTGLQDGTVTTAKLANTAVTTAKVADGAITRAKLNADVVDTTLAVSGAPADAKTTGDKLTELKTDLKSIDREILCVVPQKFANGSVTQSGLVTENKRIHYNDDVIVKEGDVILCNSETLYFHVYVRNNAFTEAGTAVQVISSWVHNVEAVIEEEGHLIIEVANGSNYGTSTLISPSDYISTDSKCIKLGTYYLESLVKTPNVVNTIATAINAVEENINKVGEVKSNYFDKTDSHLKSYYSGSVGSEVSLRSNNDYWCGMFEASQGKSYLFPRLDFDLLELDENSVILHMQSYSNYSRDVVYTAQSANIKYIAFSIYKYTGSGNVPVYTPDTYMVTDPNTDYSEYIIYPYSVEYNTDGLHNSGAVVEKVYYVGSGKDYESFTGALIDLKDDKTPKTIYVMPGAYDIYEELGGSEYLATITAQSNWKDVSVIVPDNTKIIGLGDVTLVYRPDAEDFTIPNQVTCVSPLNVVWNCEIENIKIYANNCRYCIHDEAGSLGDGTPKRKKFKNVMAIKEPNTYTGSYISGQAYASGMIAGYSYEYENCYFKSQETYCWTCHTGEGETTDSGNIITVKNCIFESPSWAGIRFGSTQGTPTGIQKYCKVSILNSYIQNKILLTRESESAPAPNQYELWMMNNNNVTIQDKFAEEGWTNIYTPHIFNTI